VRTTISWAFCAVFYAASGTDQVTVRNILNQVFWEAWATHTLSASD